MWLFQQKIRIKAFLTFLLVFISFSQAAYYNSDGIIIYNGKRLDYKLNTPLMSKEMISIPLAQTSKLLNISYAEQGNNIVLQDGLKKIVYQKKLDAVLVNGSKYFMPQNLFSYQNEWYASLKYFAWYFGYTTHRKDRIYYISKILNNVKVNEQAVQLIFSCQVSSDDFELSKDGKNEYTVSLKDTVLNFPRLTQQNDVFKSIVLSQINVNPDSARLFISSEKELELSVSMNIVIIKPKNTDIKVSATLPKPAEIKKEVIEKVRSTDKAIWIPSFRKTSDIIIKVKGKTKTIPGTAKYVKDDYVLPVEEILTPFGYDFYTDDKQVLFVRYGDKEEINTKIKVYKEGENLYVPVQKIAARLGLGLRWDWRIHTLIINPIIYDVLLSKDKSGVIIKSYSEMAPKEIFTLPNPPRLVLDIPHAVLDVTINIKNVSGSNFESVRAGQLDEETVRVVVDLKKEKNYALSLSDDSSSAYIGSAGKISKIGLAQLDGIAKLVIYGSNFTTYNWTLQNQQLVLDFPNINYEAKRSYAFTGGYLEKIVGMQHSWDPLTSRMIFYLKKDIGVEISKDKENIVLTLRRKFPTKEKKVEALVVTPKLPLSGKTIVVEAGHGGVDVGAIGYGNVFEKWFTLDISKKIQSKLMDVGAAVLMPLQTDQYMSLAARTQFANRNKADFFLSVHLNSYTNQIRNGSETYFYKSVDSEPAKFIHQAVLKKLGRSNEGIRKAHFFVLFHTDMPAVLIEPAYLSNPEEYNMLLLDGFREKIAQAVVEGIMDYFESVSGGTKKMPKTTTN